MIDNFKLAAICALKDQKNFLIPLNIGDEKQSLISEDWKAQYANFKKDKQPKEYNGENKSSEKHQYFSKKQYILPRYLKRVDSSTDDLIPYDSSAIIDLERTTNIERKDIKALVGFANDTINKKKIIMFQNYGISQFIAPAKAINFSAFSLPSMFGEYDEPKNEEGIIAIKDTLTAIYIPEDSELLFQSPMYTNKILPLDDYERQQTLASDEEISFVLNLRVFKCEDIQSVLAICDSDIRKQFTELLNEHHNNNKLDNLIIEELKKEAEENKVTINIEASKIVVPTSQSELHNLCLLLNDNLYSKKTTGESISYEAGSKLKRRVLSN
ncbi:hypothetical protein C6497_04695 [Candidatus Poribacteria bacterium]|nr:MAG: hypothetical protein C6497_04695 [Candidatus Poribacteria bacterium]